MPSPDYQPIPKPPPRIINPRAGTQKLMDEGRCRLCDVTAQVLFLRGIGLTRHHLIPRGQGGHDHDDNLIPLCGNGTTGCHGDVEHYRRMARERLRRKLHPEEIRHVNARATELGKPGYLDASYPWG